MRSISLLSPHHAPWRSRRMKMPWCIILILSQQELVIVALRQNLKDGWTRDMPHDSSLQPFAYIAAVGLRFVAGFVVSVQTVPIAWNVVNIAVVLVHEHYDPSVGQPIHAYITCTTHQRNVSGQHRKCRDYKVLAFGKLETKKYYSGVCIINNTIIIVGSIFAGNT